MRSINAATSGELVGSSKKRSPAPRSSRTPPKRAVNAFHVVASAPDRGPRAR
ncbi:MAG: hypothetical protein QM820_02095 [Minicystis sp.]